MSDDALRDILKELGQIRGDVGTVRGEVMAVKSGQERMERRLDQMDVSHLDSIKDLHARIGEHKRDAETRSDKHRQIAAEDWDQQFADHKDSCQHDLAEVRQIATAAKDAVVELNTALAEVRGGWKSIERVGLWVTSGGVGLWHLIDHLPKLLGGHS